MLTYSLTFDRRRLDGHFPFLEILDPFQIVTYAKASSVFLYMILPSILD